MNIFEVRIDDVSRGKFADLLKSRFDKSTAVKVSKINSEFLNKLLKDSDFRKVINSFDVNIVDGRGVLWVARYLSIPVSTNKYLRLLQSIWQMVYSGFSIVLNPSYIKWPIKEVIPGIEAFNLTMKVAADCGEGVFFFGCEERILESAIKNIKEGCPKLKISGYINGYDYQKNDMIDVVAEINKTDAKILIVALGVPRQEYWIKENVGKLKNIRVAIGEGGTLDRIANPSQMSPKFINSIGLEWLWRLFFNASKTEGRNRFQRTWNAVPLFIYQAVKWKIKNGQTKI